MPHVVAILAHEGVIGMELTGAAQIFAAAREPAAGDDLYEVRVCGSQAGVTMMADRQAILRVVPPHGPGGVVEADTVIVPAAFDPTDETTRVLREAHRRGARVLSICTGAFLLAAAGLLDGRRAATHWAHAARLAESYPEVQVVTDVLYVDDGDVLTSAGVAAGLDLCLHVVRSDHGATVAAEVARKVVLAPHRDGGQAQFIATPVAPSNGSLQSVLAWMQQNLAAPLTLATIAEQAATSTRTLSRQFRAQTGSTPLQWLIRVRLSRAQELLETTELTVDEIARATGFGSPLLLRQHFSRQLGTTPTAYRRDFTGQRHARGQRRLTSAG